MHLDLKSLLNIEELSDSCPKTGHLSDKASFNQRGESLSQKLTPQELATHLNQESQANSLLIPRHSLERTPEKIHEKIHEKISDKLQSLQKNREEFFVLKSKILAEIESKPEKILELNSSRRELLVQFLSTLSQGECQERSLKQWLENIKTLNQRHAIQSYFEIVASLVISQAILLKSWSDRGVRNLKEQDIQNLNWALKTALDPYVALQSRGWQVTQSTIFSWYTPSVAIQKEIWTVINRFSLSQECSEAYASLIRDLIDCSTTPNATPSQVSIHPKKWCSYDPRFYEAIWDFIEQKNLFPIMNHSGVFKNPGRTRLAFSPSISTGAFMRHSPPYLDWAGIGTMPHWLYMAEMVKLWKKPGTPPLWSVGFGFECFSKEQITLDFISPKNCVNSQLKELENCEIATIEERQCIRLGNQSPLAWYTRYVKESLADFPQVKALIGSFTTVGDLQAYATLTKLRPGAYLIWLREEPLNTSDGEDLLKALFDQSVLVAEWNLSEIQYQIPLNDQPFSKYIYLFRKERHPQVRHNHRPTRLSAKGQIRSYIELPLFFDDIFVNAINPQALQPYFDGEDSNPLTVLSSSDAYPLTMTEISRNEWKVSNECSQTPQAEWITHWPEFTDEETLKTLREMEHNSSRLGELATVRTFNKKLSHTLAQSVTGFIIYQEGEAQSLKCQTLTKPQLGGEPVALPPSGTLVLVSNESWIAPLSAWVESPWVRQWLDFRAEKKGNQTLIREKDLKWIPVSSALVNELKEVRESSGLFLESNSRSLGLDLNLNEEVEQIVQQACHHLSESDHLVPLFEKATWSSSQAAAIFVRLSRVWQSHLVNLFPYGALFRDDGSIAWNPVLKLLPKNELVSLSLHTQIQITGKIPNHTPILKVQKSKTHLPGVLVITEAGFSVHIGVVPSPHQSTVLEMLWDQIQDMGNLTWTEILQYIKLPKQVEGAKETACDLLSSFQQIKERVKTFQTLLYKCKLF